LAGPAEQARTVHPRSVTVEVRQSREHVADWLVDRRADLVSNGSNRLLYALTARRIRFNFHRCPSDLKFVYP
jgi:hypothetical protein